MVHVDFEEIARLGQYMYIIRSSCTTV